MENKRDEFKVYEQLAKGRITDTRQMLVSRINPREAGELPRYKLAELAEMQEGNKKFNKILRGGIEVSSLDFLKNIADAINVALDREGYFDDDVYEDESDDTDPYLITNGMPIDAESETGVGELYPQHPQFANGKCNINDAVTNMILDAVVHDNEEQTKDQITAANERLGTPTEESIKELQDHLKACEEDTPEQRHIPKKDFERLQRALSMGVITNDDYTRLTGSEPSNVSETDIPVNDPDDGIDADDEWDGIDED